MAKYPYVEDVEDEDGWLKITKRGFRLKCCSCALVHEIDFKHVNGELYIRMDRHEAATKAARRAIRKTVVIVDE